LLKVGNRRLHNERRPALLELDGHLRIERHEPRTLATLVDSLGAGKRLHSPPVAVLSNGHHGCALHAHPGWIIADEDRGIADPVGRCHTISVRSAASTGRGYLSKLRPVDLTTPAGWDAAGRRSFYEAVPFGRSRYLGVTPRTWSRCCLSADYPQSVTHMIALSTPWVTTSRSSVALPQLSHR